MVTRYFSALGWVLIQVLLVSSSVVSAWPLVFRAGHDGVLGCPFCEILTAYSTVQAVAVCRFMSVSVVSSAEHHVACLTGIGLPSTHKRHGKYIYIQKHNK